MNAILRDAVLRKSKESPDTKQRFFEENADALVGCAQSMLDAFEGGGRLYTMGNGGSACDAQHVAVEFQHPIFETRRPLPATALSTDTALMSAVGNDEDFSLTFVKQLRLLGCSKDIALGLSTSGKSANVNRALSAARDMGLVTVGLAGRDGGAMPDVCDHCFVVESFSIHRIQETHETAIHVLWDLVHVLAGEEDVL